jgi:hypothetical protein
VDLILQTDAIYSKSALIDINGKQEGIGVIGPLPEPRFTVLKSGIPARLHFRSGVARDQTRPCEIQE